MQICTLETTDFFSKKEGGYARWQGSVEKRVGDRESESSVKPNK